MSIRNPKAVELAKEVSKATGETLTQAVICALEERLIRLRGRKTVKTLYEEIMDISRHCRSLPDLDTRTPDEILGYNENGISDGD